MEGKLVLLVDLVGAEPKLTVDDCDWDGSRRLGDDLVLVALLREPRRRGGQALVVRAWIFSNGHAGRSRDEVLGACVDDRPSNIDVVEIHVGGGIEGHVDDLVMHGEATLADASLDPPAQLHRLAVHGRLPDHPLRPEHALVALPPFAVSGQARRHETDPAMQPVFLGRLDELVEIGRVVDTTEQRVVQAARHQHAAAPAPEPTEPHRLGVPGSDHTRRRKPGQRATVELAPADVHGPIDQHVECVAGPRSELDHPHPSLDTVAKRDEAHSGYLLETADPAHELAPGRGRPVY